MKLELDFYQRKTETVAKQLLGQILVHVVGGKRLAGRIVETEAYLGVTDMAAHSFGGLKTERTSTMFMTGGHAYVYLIYGLHSCLNVVTREMGVPEAVLIRAIEPVEGIELMRRRRKSARKDTDLTNGPGKLCDALGITRKQNAMLFTSETLFIEEAPGLAKKNIVASKRIGVDYAEHAAEWPLRFSERGNAYVSKPQPR